MDFYNLVLNNRSYRAFDENKEITMDTLKQLINMARLTPSGGNLQPLRYIPINDKSINEKVFSCLKWAGYLKDFDGPKPGNRPSGYIVMLSKANTITHDEGIAGQTILLAATSMKLGGCFIGNIDREALSSILNIPSDLRIALVIALGYPSEQIELIEINENDDIKYYRNNNIHYVPKICLDDIIMQNG